MAHLIQAKQVATAAPSQGIGASNSAGTSSSLSRADHNHTIRETSGPTDLTVGSIANNQFLKRSGTGIIGVAAVGLATKSGKVTVTSFSGNPKTATVTFATAFADANYSVSLGVETSDSTLFTPVLNSITASGFIINMITNYISKLTSIHWIAVYNGET